MKAILIKKEAPKPSKNGGIYVRCTFRSCEDGKSYLLDVYDGHWKSRKFLDTRLPLQGIYSNLSVRFGYGGKFIDGTSNFNFLGIKK